MPERVVEVGAPELKRLLEARMKQLEADVAQLGIAIRAVGISDPIPLAVFRLLASTRRHTLAAFGAVLKLRTEHPAKAHALTWLSLGAAGLSAFYNSLRLRTSAPAASQQQDRRAHRYFTEADEAFLKLDAALGCPYGCKKVRRK